MLSHLGLSTYEQYCDGDLLHQTSDGATHRDAVLKPMQHSLRVEGGLRALVDAIAGELSEEQVRLQTEVTRLTRTADGVRVTARHRGAETTFDATTVALALPPRLAARFVYDPVLDDESVRLLQSTPTWMAGHAKFLAIYDAPFWRMQGLSGDALSRRGPLAEIHDASPSSGGPYALFGFFGVDGPTRAARNETEWTEAAIDQLVTLFGREAANTRHVEMMDWSNEAATAAPSDRRAPDHHPEYGVRLQLEDSWRDVLHFIGTETAFEDGGLVEGALRQGLSFAGRVIGAEEKPVRDKSPGASSEAHTASMGWDWIDD